MAGEIIRPTALPDRPNPVASEKLPVDNGSNVGGATIKSIVEAGRPAASQLEAETGTNPEKAMTPLTTAQAMEARVPGIVGPIIELLGLGDLATKDTVNNADWSGADLTIENGGTGASTPEAARTALNVPSVAEAQALAQAIVPIYEAATGIATTNVPASVSAFRTNGYYEAGDGGGALYKEVGTEPSHGGKLLSADGRWWELAPSMFTNVRMFGARGDYTIGGAGTDDTAAIQMAWSYAVATGQRFMFIPAGCYLVTATMSDEACEFIGLGDVILVLKNMSGLDGFAFAVNSETDKRGTFSGVSFAAEGAHVRSAISTPKVGSEYLVNHTRYHWANLNFRGAIRNGSAFGNCWDYGAENWIWQGDCYGVEFRSLWFAGCWDISSDPSVQFEDGAIALEAASAIVSAKLIDITASPLHHFIADLGKAFWTAEDFDFIGHVGLLREGTGHFSESRLMRGGINVQRYGVQLNGTSSHDFTDVRIRRHASGWLGAATDWEGYSVIGGSKITINGGEVQPSSGAFSGTHRAVVAQAASGVQIDQFKIGAGVDEGIVLDNTAGSTIGQIYTEQNAAGDKVFVLKNNARRASFGEVQKVSTFSGTVISDDGTINYATIEADHLLGLERLPVPTILVIAAGVVTVTQSFHRLDTEGAAASDDLDTINRAAWITPGTLLHLTSSSSSRDITLKDGTGNMQLAGDFVLSHTADWIELAWDNSTWKEVGRSDNAA